MSKGLLVSANISTNQSVDGIPNPFCEHHSSHCGDDEFKTAGQLEHNHHQGNSHPLVEWKITFGGPTKYYYILHSHPSTNLVTPPSTAAAPTIAYKPGMAQSRPIWHDHSSLFG